MHTLKASKKELSLVQFGRAAGRIDVVTAFGLTQ